VVIIYPGATSTALVARSCDSIHAMIDIHFELEKYLSQIIDNVGLAMLDLIKKGKNGVWVSEEGQPPYAVDFLHYSKRALPV